MGNSSKVEKASLLAQIADLDLRADLVSLEEYDWAFRYQKSSFYRFIDLRRSTGDNGAGSSGRSRGTLTLHTSMSWLTAEGGSATSPL
jgi:hypothetical protein